LESLSEVAKLPNLRAFFVFLKSSFSSFNLSSTNFLVSLLKLQKLRIIISLYIKEANNTIKYPIGFNTTSGKSCPS